MANFDKAIEVVLAHEGGFVNDPVDKGGATNFGVSLRWLSTMGDLGDLDNDGDVDIDDIRLMTREQAKEIYYQEWWLKYGYYHIVNDEIATKMFDMAINMGAKQATKIVQRAVLDTGESLSVDGILGPKTIDKINRADAVELLDYIRRGMLRFYNYLIMKNHAYEKYRNGWTKRALA